MATTEKDIDHVPQIIAALAKTLHVKADSLCFCGVGRTFQECCGSSSGDNLIFIKRAIAAAESYSVSKGGVIKSIPAGIWNGVAKASQGRLCCLYPGCSEKPVSCHLIPENVLRTNFGGNCKEFRLEDGAGLQFKKVGIGAAGCQPVFCSKHDHALFDPIDHLKGGPFSEEQSFLLALKAMAFSLRKIQLLLAVDSQLEILRPLQIIANSPAGDRRLVVDVNRLDRQYKGFVYAMAFYREAMSAHSAGNWSYFKHCYRSIECETSVFFATFKSFSHDLNDRLINTTNKATAMSCNVFASGGQMHVLFSCPGELTSELHRDFFSQLALANDQKFKTALNVILTTSPEWLLLPQTFSASTSDRRKIRAAQALAVNSQGALVNVTGLTDARQAVSFLK